MNQQLQVYCEHFRRAASNEIVAAADALTQADWGQFREVIDRVSKVKMTASIANALNTSSSNTKEFVEEIESRFDSSGVKFLFGSVLSGIGGCALAEAAGLAVALGVSVLTVEVVAIALVLWGLSISLPSLWKRAMERIRETGGSFSEI